MTEKFKKEWLYARFKKYFCDYPSKVSNLN